MYDQALLYSYDESISITDLKKWNYKKDLDTSELKEWCDKNQIWAFVSWTQDYHYRFSIIKSPPHIVYYMGDISILSKDILWMVWPRDMSSYAKEVMEYFFQSIPSYDLVTVSGWADWVDTLLHRMSIQNKIPTIVVLWMGLRRYMNTHRHDFARSVVENGWLILSEFKLDMKATTYTFPQRNRIVAGLSDVMFVPEAGENSWSLISVDFANEMKRPVYWTPNNIFQKQSAGINRYIAQWKVNLLQDVDKVLSKHFSGLDLQENFDRQSISLNEAQENVLAMFAWWEVHLESIISQEDVDTDILLQTITELEIYGIIQSSKPGIYTLSQKIAK